ncbi:hypothetical protein J6500_28560 [Bradyrhizobium sp. WSM 1704]|nr:hypothetical protein [Bradyrhizobium semiaridum]MCA6125816.1 hypothetical protein [Bradyrhizobium semiaridum]
MGEQFACASLVALFSIALLVTANLFVASKSAKNLAMPAVQQVRVHL